MPLLLDVHGRAFRAGDVAHVHTWSDVAPLRQPYLWQVVDRQGELRVESRPGGETQLLTPALGQTLRLFDEPAWAQPEHHAASWKPLLALGSVMHAEKLPSKAEYLFRVSRTHPQPGQRNHWQLVIAAASLGQAGRSDEQQASLLWKHLLKEVQAYVTRPARELVAG